MLSVQAQKLSTYILGLGFNAEEVSQVATVLRQVLREPGTHYFRFSGTLRPIIDRLLLLTLLRKDKEGGVFFLSSN